MIAYLDASALVKRYLNERWSDETIELTTTAEVVATSLVSRAEVAAAFAKATRIGLVVEHEARRAQRAFAGDWQDFARIPVTEALVARAETVAWDYGLRGYDAVQLASALAWQESIGTEIVLATFDQQLWEAVPKAGLKAWPENLFLERELAEPQSTRRRRRITWITVDGGLPPGIDVSNRERLYDWLREER